MSANGISMRSLVHKTGALILFGTLCLAAHGQEVQVHGGFLSDSLKIGEQTAYYLSATYPKELTILFPDSTHAFSSFEYQKKEYFQTETSGGASTDSAVYYLTTFDIDRVQRLSLPVYIAQAQDCTVVDSPIDSVLITQMVAQVPDTVSAAQLPLRENTAYQKVHYNLNFWLIVLAIAIAVILAVLTWVIFGKRIRRYFKARRLRRNHETFIHAYDSLLAELHSTHSPFTTESALVEWKKYMEQLESRPYTKLTTRETAKLASEPALTRDLSMIDKAIYGHDTAVVAPLENLKNFATLQFRKKIKEVQHG